LSDIEGHIRRAIASGQFDDLPGNGKPLNLDDDLWVDSDWRLAHHLLKSAGYTLPWIEMLKEIDLEIEAARLTLRRAWEYRAAALGTGTPSVEADSEWQRAVLAYKDQAVKLNKRIFDLNLQVPSEKFQRLQLNPEQEIQKAKSVI